MISMHTYFDRLKKKNFIFNFKNFISHSGHPLHAFPFLLPFINITMIKPNSRGLTSVPFCISVAEGWQGGEMMHLSPLISLHTKTHLTQTDLRRLQKITRKKMKLNLCHGHNFINWVISCLRSHPSCLLQRVRHVELMELIMSGRIRSRCVNQEVGRY